MQLANGLSPWTAGSIDDQVAARLLHQRIIVLGSGGRRPGREPAVRPAAAAVRRGPARHISLYINSPGGSVSAGLAIYDTMRLIPNDVSTLALGLAGSMGQFLLTAGTPGKRFSLPHAQVLMHQGSAGFGGTAADVEIYADQLERIGADPATTHRRAHRAKPSRPSSATAGGTGGSPPRRPGSTG